MKRAAVTTMILMAGAAAQGQVTAMDAERKLTVCLHGDAATSDRLLRAQELASQMFGNIGVILEWRHGLHNCPAEGILVTLNRSTPATLKPGALAYARPYEGAHIEVFYDRISRWDPALVPSVLAHVLVHEITHVVQGINRHSAQGIMKAHWNEADYFHMRRKPLGFADADVDLIYRGLAARARNAMVAMSIPPQGGLEAR